MYIFAQLLMWLESKKYKLNKCTYWGIDGDSKNSFGLIV